MAISPYLLISCQMREIAIHSRAFLDNERACGGKRKPEVRCFGHGVASYRSLSGRQIIMNTYLKELYLSMT